MNTHLYRSRDDRMLAGVAGGLAELWDADPSLVRILWALLVPLTGGIALVVYIVMAIVVPEEVDIRPWTSATPGPGSTSDAPGGATAGGAATSPSTDPASPVAAAAAGAPGGGMSSEDWHRSRFEEREA